MKDLFKGRIVYLAEPGFIPIKVTVVGHFDTTIKYTTLISDKSKLPHSEILKSHNGKYRIGSSEMFNKLVKKTGNGKLLEDREIVLIKDNFIPSKYVQLLEEGKVRRDVQDIRLNPVESKLKVFRTLKQAERYSTYPENFGKGLLSIFNN